MKDKRYLLTLLLSAFFQQSFFYSPSIHFINEFYEAYQKSKHNLDPEFENYDIYIKDKYLKDIVDVIDRRGWAK